MVTLKVGICSASRRTIGHAVRRKCRSEKSIHPRPNASSARVCQPRGWRSPRSSMAATSNHRHRGGKKAGQIERTALIFANIGNDAQRQGDSDKPERNVNKEYPVPAGVAGNKSAQRRANNWRDQRRPCQGSNRLNQLMFRCGSQHRQPANGYHQRAAYPLKNAHRDEHINMGRQPAKHRSGVKSPAPE